MAELSTQDHTGTSNQGVSIAASILDLTECIGKPNAYSVESGEEWTCETEDGEVFTIYLDDQVGRPGKTEFVRFNIGSHDKYISMRAKDELIELLSLK